MDAERRARAYEAVERATAVPMLLLSLLLIPLLIIPLVFTIPEEHQRVWTTLDWIIWSAFAAELALKTYLAPRRLRYLRDHWFDVIVVVVPLLRPLRVVQSVRLLRLLRLARLLSLVMKGVDAARYVLGRHGLHYILLAGALLILAAATAVTIVERHAGGSITDFGTALWWAMTTVTTVGYGDTFPVTPEGRGIGVFVMLVGITVFGLLTANLAAFLVESHHDKDEPTLSEVMAQLRRMEDQLNQIRAELDKSEGAPDAGIR